VLAHVRVRTDIPFASIQGLLYLDPSEELSVLVPAADTGAPHHPSLRLVNDVTVDEATGAVYFTNTHNQFQRRTILYAYLENSPKGSVWRYVEHMRSACL